MAGREHNNLRDAEIRRKVKEAEVGHYYINAAAGTGKTQSLAERVAYALCIEENGALKYKPSDMLCVTFTNSAEKEMRSRIESILKDKKKVLKIDVGKVFIGNIHKFSLRFLRANNHGYYPYTIIDDISQLKFTDDKSLREESSAKKSKKDSDVTLDEVRKYAATMRQKSEKHPRNVRMRYFARLSKAKKQNLEKLALQYIEFKRKNALCDFDDILIDTYSLLAKKDAEKSDLKMSSFRWIQVDEVQDLNPLQHGIISKLVQDKKSTVCYFGDINQAIFSFLGTRGNLLSSFPDYDKEGHRLSFEENFRSSKSLVNMFTRYIYDCIGDKGLSKMLKPVPRKAPNNFHIWQFENEADEHNRIARLANSILEYNNESHSGSDSKKYKYGYDKSRRRTAAILVRTGEQADDFSRSLLLNGVSHLKVSGTDSLKRDAIRTLLSHFGVINDEFSRADWARILHHLHCGSDIRQARAITHTMHNLGITPSDFLVYEDSTYLNEFYKSASKACVVYHRENSELFALKIEKGEISGDAFREKVDSEGEWQEKFSRYIGTAALVSYETELKMNSLLAKLKKEDGRSDQTPCWSLVKMSRLLSDNEIRINTLGYLVSGLPREQSVPQDLPSGLGQTVMLLRSYLHRAEELLPKQKSYLNTLGTEYIRRRLRGDYLKIYSHTRSLYESTSQKNSDVRLANEFRWVYGTMLRKHIIHNFNYAIIDRKLADYNMQLDPYTGGRIDSEFEVRWARVIEEDAKQIELKTKYYFTYLEKDVFSEGKNKLVRTLLSDNLQEIKFIRESDLCRKPYVKESVYIMTVHQAKGHEFTDVFLTGATDKSYPFSIHKLNWEIEEDKRLFYVAMTRTKRNLDISYSTSYLSPYSYGKKSMGRSPFIKSIEGYFNSVVEVNKDGTQGTDQ